MPDNYLASLRLPTAKPSSSTQAVKSKSESRLRRELEGPRAGELKVLSILATGIPENAALFGPTLSCTKGYLQLPLAGFAGRVSGIPPSAELESIRVVVSPR
jgi:hypothetical protein